MLRKWAPDERADAVSRHEQRDGEHRDLAAKAKIGHHLWNDARWRGACEGPMTLVRNVKDGRLGR